MNDYARIAKVILYLDDCYQEQPDLDTVSHLLGLSPFHFHRIFRRWAGITPKAFVQCLTLQEAKAGLRAGRSVLDSALRAGLSGPSRLHDLCVKLEAATPGEIKSRGRGLLLEYGIGVTPFGPCLLGSTTRGICHLAFFDQLCQQDTAIVTLRDAWPNADLSRSDAMASKRLADLFPQATAAPEAPITAWVRGTNFQIRVWQALLQVPPGHLTSYGQVARAIGHSGAARAVGTAVAANPLAYLIPCHRVIRETGAIGNYRWGHGRKRTLIAWERALTPPGAAHSGIE